MLVGALATACQTLPRGYTLGTLGSGTGLAAHAEPAAPATGEAPAAGISEPTISRLEPAPPPAQRRAAPALVRGSGRFVHAPAAAAAPKPESGTFTLNFENTRLREVVQVVLGDLLKENYVFSPRVRGTVTLQTSRPLPKSALLATLETVARMNGAAVVRRDGIYHVVPRDEAIRGLASPQLGTRDTPIPAGYGVRIVPLRFVGASEMQKILEPFTHPGNVVRVDPDRNLLVLAGTSEELASLSDIVEIFDVDWLAGMSFGLFVPEFVSAKALAKDLAAVFGDAAKGPLAGLVRIVPIERLNALLVISPREAYVKKVSQWIDRFDRDAGVGRKLYVYHVQNGKAADLAKVLTDVFQEKPPENIPGAQVAPGLEPAQIQSEPTTITTTANTPQEAIKAKQAAEAAAPPSAPRARTPSTAREGLSISPSAGVRIIADEVNNALLVMATADEYRQVAAAIRKLDVVPLQVLIEATIAEVTLTDNLSQGLEWYFNNNLGARHGGVATLDLGTAGIAGITPGFSYAITDSAGTVKAVLNALASQSKLNVISSPSLMVLNNQKASIQVGDQVPITTQQQQATVANSTIVNSIQFRDTGVLLTVTPRVNAGGLVTMDLEQEVSDIAPGTAGTLTPTIQQRKISSTVAVQSGQTVVLGGLIRDRKSAADFGIPGLHQIPVLGWLFGTKSDEQKRTELVVLITPRAVLDKGDARRITDEFRQKMESLKPISGRKGDGPLGAVSP